MLCVALRSRLTLLCWRRGSATMAHLGGDSRKRKRDEDTIFRVLTDRRWGDFVTRLHKRYLMKVWYEQINMMLEHWVLGHAVREIPLALGIL